MTWLGRILPTLRGSQMKAGGAGMGAGAEIRPYAQTLHLAW